MKVYFDLYNSDCISQKISPTNKSMHWICLLANLLSCFSLPSREFHSQKFAFINIHFGESLFIRAHESVYHNKFLYVHFLSLSLSLSSGYLNASYSCSMECVYLKARNVNIYNKCYLIFAHYFSHALNLLPYRLPPLSLSLSFYSVRFQFFFLPLHECGNSSHPKALNTK